MRTRFLNIDYFASSPPETLTFLNLPVPHLPTLRLAFSNEDELLRFDCVINLPLTIERLPIDGALSKFLSDVIPDKFGVEYEDFEATRSRNGHGCFDGWMGSCSGVVDTGFSEEEAKVLYEEKEVENKRAFISRTMKQIDETADDENTDRFEMIQFEVPEPDILLNNPCFYEDWEIRILSQVSEIENHPDMVKPGHIMQSSSEAEQAIYSLDYVSSEYHVEEKTPVFEDSGSFRDQMLLQHRGFALLEVDEISLTKLTGWSMEAELLLFLDKIQIEYWTENYDLLANDKESLGSLKYDILELLSDNSQSKQFIDSESFGMFVEMDIISLVEMSQTEGSSAFCGAKSDDYFSYISPLIFQEFQILDVDISQKSEVFLSMQTTNKPETCDCMFKEDVNFKNFSDLIVSHELALADDTFKSLPVPILSNHGKIKSLYATIEEMLLDLKSQPLSASDGIYLDWFLLEDDKHSNIVYFSYQDMLKEINSCSINFDSKLFDDEVDLVFDFIFSDDALSQCNMVEYKDSLITHSDCSSMIDNNFIGVVSGELLDTGQPKPGIGEPAEYKSERKPLSFEFSNLHHFSGPLSDGSVVGASNACAESPEVPFGGLEESCSLSNLQLKQRNIIFHNVKLSSEIVTLIGHFEKSYLSILQSETDLSSFSEEDEFKLLSLPKEKLMDCIKKKLLQRRDSRGDENIMAFVSLCAIKQIAWYTCFYGIHVTYLYIEKLSQSLDSLKSRLSSLYSLIDAAKEEVDKEICRSHPSLSAIQQILRSNTSQSSSKVLIFADQVFWCSLKRLFTSMGLSCNELCSYKQGNQPDLWEASKHTKSQINAMLISDCFFASHEQASTTFPFGIFSIILEYGGSSHSSRVSFPSSRCSSLPRLHFINIEADNSSALSALCKGVGMPQIIKMTVERDSDSSEALDEILKKQRLEGLLNFVPLEEKCNMGSMEAVDRRDCLSFAVESDIIQQTIITFPNTVIVVNTQHFDKEMIISRRSTYQKILAMEKEGAQVIERDSNLPVDLMLSPAICLVWYDCRNIGMKAAALGEDSSCLPLCIENIATTILTMLSFTFSCCILIFEGESTSLSMVMESSGELYAAAASLCIDLQLFCSYSAELTAEIILGSIGYAVKLTRSLYPKMLESESLAESFLTKFPSVNPLTAHAMLSSGGTLKEFLGLTNEQRILAMQRYYTSVESIALFSALCRYGEREDSKSIMTDCSSSVSSGPDSDKCHFKLDSIRERKYIDGPQKVDINIDDLLQSEPFDQITDDILNPSGTSKPYASCMSKNPDRFDENREPGSFLEDMLDQKRVLGLGINNNPSKISRQNDSRMYEGVTMRNKSLKDKFLGPNQKTELAVNSNLGWWSTNNSGNLQKDFIGELVDPTDSPSPAEDICLAANSMSLTTMMEEDYTRQSAIARRLSFDYPSFPTAAEINSDSYLFGSLKDQRQNFQGLNDNPVTDGDSDKLHLVTPKRRLEEVLMQISAGSKRLSFEEEISYYGGTPFSKAIRSANPQPGSPWTIEFLNRIREKSRLRQQARLCDSSTPFFEASRNISKTTKRKSPSILEFFKYQGSGTSRKTPKWKNQKQPIRSSCLPKGKRSSALLPSSCTPVDKRARQTLSFAMNENGSQTKLVWSDGSAQHSKKFRKQ